MCVSLSFSIFAFSASAVEEIPSIADDLYFDLMPYFYMTDSGPTMNFEAGYASVDVSLPSALDVNYIDMVVACSSDFNCWVAGGGTLSVLALGNELYRVYGNLTLGLSDTLQFWFEDTSNSGSTISVVSCKAMCNGQAEYPLTGSLTVVATDFVNNGGSYTMEGPGYPIRINFGGGNSSPSVTPIAFYPWNATITLPVAKQFDFVDVFFYGGASSLASITVKHNNNAVPFSISYLGVGADSWYTTTGFAYNSGTASMPEFNEFGGIVRIDLRECNRLENANVEIYFVGTASPYYAANYMMLQSVTGYICSPSEVDPSLPVLSGIHKFIADTFPRFESYFMQIESGITSFKTSVSSLFQGLGQMLVSKFADLSTLITNKFQSLFDLMGEHFTGMKEFLTDLFNPDRSDISDQGASVSDQIDQIDQVEDSALADVQSNVGSVTKPIGNVGKYANALAFCSNILGRTFTNLYDYQIVILLPLAIGVFMFICSRAPGNMSRKFGGSSGGRHKHDFTVEGGKD